VRECFKGDEASQWKRPKLDPSPHQNPLTDLHKNWQAWLSPGRHPAWKILYRSVHGFLFPIYAILPCFWGCFLFVFLGSSIRLQPTPLDGYLRKIRQITSFRVRKCLFGMTIFYIWTLKFPKKPPFRGPILTGLSFFSTENRFNIRMLKYKLPLIVTVAT